MALNEIEIAFDELLFGAGAWLGLLIIVSIILLVSLANKYAVIVFIPISIFMGISYLNNVANNSDVMWGAIIMFLMPIFLALRLAKDRG